MTTRRQIMAAMAGGILASQMAAFETAAQPRIRKPARLQAGDRVGIVAPASPVDGESDIARAEEAIRALGLDPIRGANVNRQFGYLAGGDHARAADINAMFADNNIKALFALRGGWGAARILPYLDWDAIRANPKLLVGYSDITALHMAIQTKCGFATIHGPNATSSWWENSENSFRSLAFDAGTPALGRPPLPPGSLPDLQPPDGEPEIEKAEPAWPKLTIGVGKARGTLLGGNLTVLNALVGTGWLPDFKGAILFLEDIDEAEYRIDRMLTQLGQAGILRQLSGFVFGQCTRCSNRDPDVPGSFSLEAVLQQKIAPLGIPAFTGANFGHVRNQYCIPVGVAAEIDADAGTITMLEPVVA